MTPSGADRSPQRIALCLQYDGAAFHGWQRQPNADSVQAELERAIRILDDCEPSPTVAAGRTDAGVHAAAQVAHFDTRSPMAPVRWARALNGALAPTVRVLESRPVAASWHACFSASHRRYRYLIFNGRHPNLFLARQSWHRYRARLDDGAMSRALRSLLGHHDFSAFQRAGSHRSHARTTVQEVALERHGDLIELEVQASGFLYGMVRLLVGQLVAVGEGRISEAVFDRRWRQQRRAEVKEAAPPQGLCLLRVGYPEPVFSRSLCHDALPHIRLATSDAPDPPGPGSDMELMAAG
ncbi:tRNA pseudouridine(38-40) synthase TruA [Synechococcus sp. RSCCF101]|uniref:tRNA pseudouridine(38-40) synthase TruA n=1 Tax=Synechococcus sp. RSCCF101 TaxID=2511069 RepID=UPI00124749B2|nr:tRNA pseudouridine(38-40) synthase TruA [Synechococcus sp. RSCCF101]